MVNRRHIRIKVLQAIYGFMQSGHTDLKTGEENLKHSIDKIYDLYLIQLALAIELLHESYREREDARNKYFPTEDDLKQDTSFTQNRILNTLSSNEALQKMFKSKKISWQLRLDIPQKIFRKIRFSDFYKAYLQKASPTLQDDKNFIINCFESFIFNDEILESYYEELSIHWADDIYIANVAVLKTIQSIEEGKTFKLPRLLNDAEGDMQFAYDLFRKTIIHNDNFDELIKMKVQNWEMERIAMMDMLLMKMALTELLYMPSIPVKVSLNEYIELSKMFSTMKSNIFINGILDKLVADLREENKITKTGRGLIDN